VGGVFHLLPRKWSASCHGSVTGNWTGAGAVCSRNGVDSPGCDYNANGTKINVNQSTSPIIYFYIGDDGSTYAGYNGSWNAGNSIWTSNEGVEFSCGDLNCDGSGLAINSFSGSTTKDVDLQRANLQSQNLSRHAQAVADQFEMSLGKATQLVQLAQKVQLMTAQNRQMTAADQQAVSNAAFGVAGVTATQVNDAINRAMQGDSMAAEAVLSKAAQNLGMPSASALRDKLLPALGYDVN
jgi:hypothetical protein